MCRVASDSRVLAVFLLAAAGAVRTASAQPAVPRYERADCPFPPGAWASSVRLECGYLVVYRNRERPSAGTFRLAVAILHPLTPSTDPPLVLPHGGPSGPGGLRGGEMSFASRNAPILKRDIIVYDLRGAGFSEPALCPETVQQGERGRNEPDRARRQALWNAGARACVDNLTAHGIDPGAFNTTANAADLIDLRKTLGYRQWDAMGVSYGSRLVQEIMRRDPDGVRSAILDSPVIPGPGQQAEVPVAFQRVLDHTFVSCAAQPTCAAAFPTLTKDFYELYDELNATPVEVIYAMAETTTVRFDGERLIRALHNGFGMRASRTPLFIHELKHGDRVRTARLLLGNSAVARNSNVLTDLVGCYEGGGAAYQQHLASAALEVRAPFRPLLNTAEECPIWQERFATPAEREFVRSDIPTLILTKEFDDRTPTDYGRRIAAGLTHVQLLELRGVAHGQSSECQRQIVLSFLANPARAPDISCAEAIPPLSFETRNLEPRSLVMVIASTGPAPSPFAGRWEAVFGGAPVIYRFDLQITGRDLTGVINVAAQAHPIFDGHIDGQTISFKANSPDGGRTVTFTGSLRSGELLFTRTVQVLPGGNPGGVGLFGASGPSTFTAIKVN